MRRMARWFLVFGLLVGEAAWAAGARRQAVSHEEAAHWLQYVVPLPKRIAISGKVIVPASRVRLDAGQQAEPLVRQAVAELRECMGQPDGPRRGGAASFTIALQEGGGAAEPLKEHPNSDQAYRITTEKGEAGLRLAALGPQGLYYAAKTLQQLIRAKRRGETVQLPLMEVTDWPDMRHRGVWGVDAYHHLRWLSDRKMNYMEQIAASRVDEHKRPSVGLAGAKALMVKHGPTFGINAVPAILHLEQQHNRGLFRVYPELRGRGGEEGAICYAQPVFVDILAEWIAGYARMPGVREVDVWMTENLHGKGGCRCPVCAKENRDLQEARVIVAAWKKARRQMPGVGLWTLTSEETADSNEAILRELPPEIGVWYYHSLLTYTTGEAPMVPAYMMKLARRGRRIGVCCNLSAKVGLTLPFTGAAFVHYRMNEFVGKGMCGVLGYPTPRVHYNAYNVEAAAEWSWNAKGRSPREFAMSWAVRQGMQDPARFAEWSETLGPVAWDVYGSDWPGGERRRALKKVTEQLTRGKLPELGFVLWGVFRSPWGDIKSAGQLDRDVAQAERAVELARQMRSPAFLQESLVIQGLVRSLKALWELKSLVTAQGIDPGKQAAARRWFRAYVDSLKQAKESLPKWETAVAGETRGRSLVGPTTDLLGKMIERMSKTAADLGVKLK